MIDQNRVKDVNYEILTNFVIEITTKRLKVTDKLQSIYSMRTFPFRFQLLVFFG